MAQFRSTIQGSRGQASRLGGKDSGMTASVNGWQCGVHVDAEYDTDTNEDVFRVYLSGGSLGAVGRCLLTVRKPSGGDARIEHHDI